MQHLLKALTWTRRAVAAVLMLWGLGMVNAVADLDNPHGAPTIYLLWGFLSFVLGTILVLEDVIRNAE